jgi:hypothetical protein
MLVRLCRAVRLLSAAIKCGYFNLLSPVGVRTLTRSFESLNSGLRHGGLDPKSELRPEAFGAWFGCYDYSGRSFPIEEPLPHFHIDRFYT